MDYHAHLGNSHIHLMRYIPTHRQSLLPPPAQRGRDNTFLRSPRAPLNIHPRPMELRTVGSERSQRRRWCPIMELVQYNRVRIYSPLPICIARLNSYPHSVDSHWKGLTNALAGMFCASVNFIDQANTGVPSLSFRPEGVYSGNGNCSVLALIYREMNLDTRVLSRDQ